MSLTFLYKKTSNQAVKLSSDPNAFDNFDPVFFDTITDPTLPNGADLAIPKIKQGTTIQNATGTEILGFPVHDAADQVLMDRTSAINSYDLDPITKKVLKAIVQLMLDEINTLRAQHSLGERTPAQAKAAIEGMINAGDYD